MKKIILRALCLLLASVALFTLWGCKRGSDVPLSPGLSMIEGEPIYDKGVAMKTQNFTVTDGMMAFFFYDYGGDLMAAMEQEKPYDKNLSLHEQTFSEGRSWYDVMMNETLKKVSELLIYCEAAHAAGIGLTDAQKSSIDSEISTATMTAAGYYGKTLDEYLQALYGPLMNEQALRDVLALELLANSHSLTVNKTLEEGIAEAEIKAYAEAHGLKDDTLSRHLSLLAIPYVNGEPEGAKASEVLSALQNSPKHDTLAGFAAYGSLAEEENLTPDNIGSKAIGDWLFAEDRSPNDCGRVDADGYTYILCYTGEGMPYKYVSARMHLYDSAFSNWYNGWVETLTFGYNYDVLDSYDIA